MGHQPHSQNRPHLAHERRRPRLRWQVPRLAQTIVHLNLGVPRPSFAWARFSGRTRAERSTRNVPCVLSGTPLGWRFRLTPFRTERGRILVDQKESTLDGPFKPSFGLSGAVPDKQVPPTRRLIASQLNRLGRRDKVDFSCAARAGRSRLN